MKIFIVTMFLMTLFSNSYAQDCELIISQEKLCFEIKWVEGPKFDAYSKATFLFWKKGDAQKTPVSPSREIDIYPWMIMANMEHGSRPVVLKNTAPGVYEVSKIYFSQMPGTWEMRVRYSEADRRTQSLARVKVEFP